MAWQVLFGVSVTKNYLWTFYNFLAFIVNFKVRAGAGKVMSSTYYIFISHKNKKHYTLLTLRFAFTFTFVPVSELEEIYIRSDGNVGWDVI